MCVVSVVCVVHCVCGELRVVWRLCVVCVARCVSVAWCVLRAVCGVGCAVCAVCGVCCVACAVGRIRRCVQRAL